MKNCIILILLLLFICTNTLSVCAREKYRNENVLSSYELNEIKSMEKNLFNYSFDNEEPQRRLERLELKVFNVVSTECYKNRITALKSALNNYNTYSSYTITQPYYYPYNVPRYNPYHQRPHNYNAYKYKLNTLRNLKSYLNGTMTGYTLPIQNNNYDLNNNFYSNGGNIQEYVGRGHSGFRNTTSDGGFHIKILD